MSTTDDAPPKVAERVVNSLTSGIGAGRIPLSMFGNEDLYRRELRAIFGRCWVYLGHESEIESPGDYVLRTIGEDSFIVIRDDEGTVRAHYDACRHRGVQLCRADSGNTSHFRCPYHGWTYNSKGELVGAPLWRNAYGGMDKAANGLASAAHVDTYHGMIFATLDPSAPPLRRYLGEMTWYLDLVFGLNSSGVEVLGPPQRFVVDANWKSGAENFSGDDYHLGTLHKSVWDIGAFPVPFSENMIGYHVRAEPGHSMTFSIAEADGEAGPSFFGFPPDVAATFDTSLISAEQLDVARRSRVFAGTIFPNLSVLVLPVSEDAAQHPPTAMLNMRVWQPRGPGKVEIWNWFCAYRNMTEQQKDRIYRAGLGTFSMGGIFEIDDTEPWITSARTGRSVAAEVLDFQLNYQMGKPGVGISRPVPDWPGPGSVSWPRYSEDCQLHLYDFYRELMTTRAGEWPEGLLDG